MCDITLKHSDCVRQRVRSPALISSGSGNRLNHIVKHLAHCLPSIKGIINSVVRWCIRAREQLLQYCLVLSQFLEDKAQNTAVGIGATEITLNKDDSLNS